MMTHERRETKILPNPKVLVDNQSICLDFIIFGSLNVPATNHIKGKNNVPTG